MGRWGVVLGRLELLLTGKNREMYSTAVRRGLAVRGWVSSIPDCARHCSWKPSGRQAQSSESCSLWKDRGFVQRDGYELSSTGKCMWPLYQAQSPGLHTTRLDGEGPLLLGESPLLPKIFTFFVGQATLIGIFIRTMIISNCRN